MFLMAVGVVKGGRGGAAGAAGATSGVADWGGIAGKSRLGQVNSATAAVGHKCRQANTEIQPQARLHTV